MDLRHLRYFVALAEELHFTRAARRLGMAQPPLSQQIRALEAELATPLLERGTRRVALTEAGRMFLAEARATLAAAARAELVARRAGRGEIGELRIGLFASAPLLPAFTRAVLAFRARLPDVHLALSESPTLEQVDALRRGALDAGFLRCPSAETIPPEVAAVELLRERLVAMLRRDHPLAAEAGPLPVAALRGQKLIFFARSVGTTLHAQLAALCHAAGFAPEITQTARENSTLIGLVAAGLGIAVVPESLAQIQVADVVHRPLDDPRATTSIWLATPREAPSALARALLDCAVPFSPAR
ncbi:LysR substrate-binding domain-containing protein [Falsiroseomonas selenitidurans]|uniref:LysR family transcriptional regulator n=1 Tax=Falsiroseomonas selenitidurans TaxID=2716335 RepID=A0ABX1E2Q1_9PROT|nr:LysR substrate-binding domain-containing protein [Falsiroseomonas selenitidurans]NKC31445.1 LysR family transcriptional regulator [Falsiroseomonas selenitidurans]